MSQTIVMIHGMFGGSWCWDNYRGFFERKGYRCLTPALRYHDVDPKDEPHPGLGTVSLLDYADDLGRAIRSLGEKPVIIGHSMGGLITQILGSRGLGRSLVLLTSAAPSRDIGRHPNCPEKPVDRDDRMGLLEETRKNDLCIRKLLGDASPFRGRAAGCLQPVCA